SWSGPTRPENPRPEADRPEDPRPEADRPGAAPGQRGNFRNYGKTPTGPECTARDLGCMARDLGCMARALGRAARKTIESLEPPASGASRGILAPGRHR